ncbi:MAG: homing endonuclease associated repeat-containing protein [Aminipila sp.]
MQKKEIVKYKENLQQLAKEATDLGQLEYNKESEEHKELMSIYKIKSQTGKFIYEAFSDEELCDYIRKRATELTHVPAQKEIYWIYRMYIKHRFVNWPKALRVSVLSSKAGQDGHSITVIQEREKLCNNRLMEIRKKADELHRPPHMAEMKYCIEDLKYKYETWAEVLKAAGINQQWKNKHMLFVVENFTEEEEKLIEVIKEKVIELGRAPLRKEIEEEVREKLKVKCKTWRNTLYQIGIEPIEKQNTFDTTYLNSKKNKEKRHNEILNGGLFKIVKPNSLEKEYLRKLKNIIKELGRAPLKEELDKNLYEKLMHVCGSYRNILYQVGAEPLDKTQQQRIRRLLRRNQE